jgi:hypothetical protein
MPNLEKKERLLTVSKEKCQLTYKDKYMGWQRGSSGKNNA